MATSTLTINIDDNLRERAESFYSERGIDLSKAICNLLYRSIGQEDNDDPPYTDHDIFYSSSNIVALMDSIKSGKEGKFVEKTMDELRAYEE